MGKLSFRSFPIPFFITSIIVLLLQVFILKPHLRYGFADVDWNFLVIFKEISSVAVNPLDHLLRGWTNSGVYTYQIYYIGLIEKFFGMDYANFQLVTHFFKLISTLTIYPLVLILSKNKLVAALTTILYGVAYSAVGVMYTVVTSGLFVAIPFMNLFFIYYYYLVNKKENKAKDILIAVFLFFITLFLATERMYPLLPILFIVELFVWFKKDFSKREFYKVFKRLSFFSIPFLLIFLFKTANLSNVSGNTAVTFQKFMQGNWQVIVSPVISFGSLFLPRDYWNYIGSPNISNFSSYLNFLIKEPMVVFGLVSIFFSFLWKKRIRFVVINLGLTFIFSLLVYFLSSHQLKISPSVRIPFDVMTIIPALIGGFVISLNILLFKKWLDEGKKDDLIIVMTGAIFFSLVYIISTWVAADWILVFTGVHRYLTIPAIGSSLFIAGLITIIFRRLDAFKRFRLISYTSFILIIPIITLHAFVINEYFKYELNYAGTDASGHIRMKNKLWSYLNNFSNTEPSIFYFDESKDHDNGYFDETTVMAGFNYWMRFRGRVLVDAKLTPALLRSNLICSEERSMCLSKVKELVVERDNEKGILYGGIFYKKENFYAFRFLNKDLVDIKPEITKTIDLD
jgi:hypothetical protein